MVNQIKSSKAQAKRQSSERRSKRARGAHTRETPGRVVAAHSAERQGVLDEQWLQQMRGLVRCISQKFDEIESQPSHKRQNPPLSPHFPRELDPPFPNVI